MQYTKLISINSNRLNELSNRNLSLTNEGLLILGEGVDLEKQNSLLRFAKVSKEISEQISSPSLLLGHVSETDDYNDIPFIITIDDEDLTKTTSNELARMITNKLGVEYDLVSLFYYLTCNLLRKVKSQLKKM